MSAAYNDNEKHPYTAGDIRRYLAGEMPAREMHALELAAQNDPMLDDALTGMQEVKTDLSKDLASLQHRVAERSVEKNTSISIRRTWLKIAAAVLAMVALSALGYYFISGTSSNREIALSDKKVDSAPVVVQAQPEADVPAPATSMAPTDSGPGNNSNNLNRSAARQKAVTASSGAPVVEEKTLMAKKSKLRLEKSSAAPGYFENRDRTTNSKSDEQNINDPADDDKAAAVAGKPQTRAFAETAPAMLQGKVAGVDVVRDSAGKLNTPSFSGQVVDDKGSPVSGAMVQMGKARTVTDVAGRFILRPSSADSSGIDVSSVGFQKMTFVNNGLAHDNLQLKIFPVATALNNVVITGYGASKKQSTDATGPVPAPGWKKYRRYLGINKIPSAIDSSLHGTERVSFSITRNGEPVDFSCDESLSIEHDSLAVRIIRNGPKWKPAKDSTHRVSLAIPY